MRLPFLGLVGFLWILNSCALAPGMVYDQEAPENGVVDSSATFEGMQVHLRSITPDLVRTVQSDQSVPLQMPGELLAVKPQPYQLGMYDVITVTVWEHPELTLPLGQYRSDLASGQMVDEQGYIFYPYVGSMVAQNHTAGEMRARLLQSLSTILNNPQLDVKITGFQSKKVYVHGEVLKPCVVPVTNVPLTLLQAINTCGGLGPEADASRVQVQRQGMSLALDLYGVYEKSMGPAEVLLQDGDVIRVPSRNDAKVYVMGEVQKQAAVPLVHGKLSLLQALAEVGGLSPLTAESKGIYVIRYIDSAQVNVFHLNARNPLALALGDQFALSPRDVVFVDATGMARWNRVISLILPTASLLNNVSGFVDNTSTSIETINDLRK